MAYELSETANRRAVEAFERVLDSALPAYELGQLNLFAEDDEDFIKKEVERKLYPIQLPNAGSTERRMIERFKKLARDREWADSWRAAAAAREWEKLLPRNPRHAGRYYVRHALAARTNKDEFNFYRALRDIAEQTKNWDRKWFAEQMLEGMPEAVSNFDLECLYLLKRADGNMDRLVRLRNVMGETSGLVRVDSRAFHAPEKFREWCLNQGNFDFNAGVKELQKLHEDVSHSAAWRVINEVVSLGWLPVSDKMDPEAVKLDGIWFFGDCAYADGKLIEADDDGIYWWKMEGYQVSEQGRENAFCQKRPMLRPDKKPADCKLDLRTLPELHAYEFEKGKELRDLFREICERMVWSVGGPDAYLLVGSVLSFVSAPEIFARYSMFPGLWLHGLAESGKSTIVEWLMEIFGFTLHNGMIVRGNSVSAVGLQQAADQYSNLPVWLDEFRNAEVTEDKIAVIHNGFNRGGQFKFNPSRIQRAMRTNFIVTGESTLADSAMRGRFPHVQISANRRMGTPEEQKENYNWFQNNRHGFFLIGRYLMENRAEFTQALLGYFDKWSVEGISKRNTLAHGVAVAAWTALAFLLESHTIQESGKFSKWIAAHAKEAAKDVRADLNINMFWEYLMAAFDAGELSGNCFKVERKLVEHAPGEPDQTRMGPAELGWDECVLCINAPLTLKELEIYLTKARTPLPLKRQDLRDQLSKEDYWVAGDWSIRFGRGASTSRAWKIALNKHPLGYNRVNAEVYAEFLKNPEAGDPRKGPLFAIMEKLLTRVGDEDVP